jgi:hypothetical protein
VRYSANWIIPEIDAKRGDYFLQADFPVQKLLPRTPIETVASGPA